MKKLVNNEVLLDFADEMMKDGHTVSLCVAGYSMRPILEHRRDSVTLTKANLDTLARYDVVLFKYNGCYVLHRIINIDNDNLTLMGDGNLAGTESCKKSDVIAIATNFLRKGRTIDCSSKWFRRYGQIWVALRPIRRWLLLCYRIKIKLIP